MFSSHNQGKSVVDEIFIRELQNLQIYEFKIKKCVY